MNKIIQLLLLSLAILLTNPLGSGVHGAVLRANEEENAGSGARARIDNAAVERELQRRRMNGGGRGASSGKGKGKGGSKSSKGSKGGSKGREIRFLPDRIEPIPFVNCIPLPPGYGDSKSKSKSDYGSKGKGKGQRRNRRNNSSSHRIRERLLRSDSNRILHGRNRGGNRMGARRQHGGGLDHHHHRHTHDKKMKKMMMARLPYCPPSAPTLFPTALPSFTPIPTATPLPSITPFPSFTPFPSLEETEDPETPTEPTTGPAPTGAPVAVPDGTTRILVESTLEYRLFDTATPRQPTQEELDGLMVETTRFYTELLTAAYPNLESFDATFVSDEFNAANELPILIDFDANAFFTEGTTVPTAAEVFAVLEGANYQDYITNYVWLSEPLEETIFFETQEVAYNARVTTGLPGI